MLQDFGYLAPKSLTELYAVLKKNSGKAIILAGGTDVIVRICTMAALRRQLLLMIKNRRIGRN